MDSFTYQPLAPGEIRILTLQQGGFDDEIYCTLEHAILDDIVVEGHGDPLDDTLQPREYEFAALSYVWGDASRRKQIFLKHAQDEAYLVVEIGQNLASALRHLRLSTKNQRMWADAICINQNDLLERAAQVPLMASIYAGAFEVLAWTGEATEKSSAGLSQLAGIGIWYNQNREELNSRLRSHNRHDRPATSLIWEVCQELGLDLASLDLPAILDVSQREYWSRVWIIQELAVRSWGWKWSPNSYSGARCVVFCGRHCTHKVLIDMAGAFLPVLRDTVTQQVAWRSATDDGQLAFDPRHQELLESGLMRMCSLLIEQHYFGSSHFPLERFRLRALEWGATDSRDRIFAFLGLAQKRYGGLIPDYSKSIHEVSRDYVKFLIQTDHNLECLRGNQIRNRGLSHSLPSWAPILENDSFSRHVPATWLPVERSADFNADNNSLPRVSFGRRGDRHVLSVEGIFIGVVENTIGPCTVEPLDSQILGELHERHSATTAEGFAHAIFRFWHELPLAAADGAGPTRFDLALSITNQWSIGGENQAGQSAPPHVRGHGYFVRALEVMIDHSSCPEGFMPSAPQEARCANFISPLMPVIGATVGGRCIFTTRCGKIGVGPFLTRPGDVAVILFGSAYCFVLRPVQLDDDGEQNSTEHEAKAGDNEYFELLGDAYVSAAMDGRMVDGPNARPSRLFNLV